MKIFLLYLTITFFAKNGWSQGQELKINQIDSLQLDSTWNVFKNAVILNDRTKLKELSIDSIYCQLCDTSNQFDQSAWIIPVNDFINLIPNRVFEERIWKVINSEKYSLLVREFVDWHPINWNIVTNGNYILYEIIYVTYKKDELAIGHEGQNYLFQFCKVNGKFKFVGVQTIP